MMKNLGDTVDDDMEEVNKVMPTPYRLCSNCALDCLNFRGCPRLFDLKKKLCFSTIYEDSSSHWFIIDPRSDKETEIVKMKTSPPYLDLFGFGVTLVESKVFIIGGYRGHRSINQVFIFNIETCRWSEGPSLKQARSFPLVVVIGKKIYVFGTDFNIPVEHWGEFYDLESQDCKEWQTISGPTQNIQHFYSTDIDAAVAYKGQIRFWGDFFGIHSYSLDFNTWTFSKEGFRNGPKPPFNFMSNHVVYGDFALWQYCGRLYAWDLTNNTTSRLSCILEDVYFAPDPLDIYAPPEPSHLLYAGDGLLCFLRWNLYQDGRNFGLYKFHIEGSRMSSGSGPCNLKIVHDGTHFFDIPGDGIQYAIAVCADCTGTI